ncbi:hypothetical protein DITRI_Ditri03aG0082200 [Diplodiscus trichospermus]
MGNFRVGLSLSLMVLLMVAMTILEGAIAADYTVGEDYGWDVPPNNSSDFYSRWGSRYEFKVGDVAIFNWTGNHTIARVPNKADFDECNRNAAAIFVRGESGASARVNLNTEGINYFICAIGTHCEQGQKVAFNVKSDASSAPKQHPTVVAISILLSALAIFLLAH